MNKKELSVIVVSIAMYYMVITSIFKFLNILKNPLLKLIFDVKIKIKFTSYTADSVIWFVFAIIVILLCYRFLKRLNKDESIYLNNKASIRAITGVVVALQGGIDFFISLPTTIYFIKLYYSPTSLMNIEPNLKYYMVMIYIIIILLQTIQILSGIYLVKSSKNI